MADAVWLKDAEDALLPLGRDCVGSILRFVLVTQSPRTAGDTRL